ncbi:MAG: endolytic transglycosylase MltG [Clostridiales bacterium]|jgi:UPF0755 protein|nr:endolytic transglycosylase MltG [Clostridiales bacterium]
MPRSKIYEAIWNAMSFVLGTAYNWIILVATVVLVWIFVNRGYTYGEEMASTLMDTTETEASVVVEDEDTLSTVSQQLQEKGIIPNALLFQLEKIVKSYDTEYKPGEYVLNSSMSTSDLGSILTGKTEDKSIQVTILEGFTIKDIAEYLTYENLDAGATFVEVCDSYKLPSFMSSIPSRINPLEGYLYPGTYQIPADPSPEDLIGRMLDRFYDVYSKYEAKAKERKLTMDEVITIASIIEKEAKSNDDKLLVSEVISNRLNAGMKLEMTSPLSYRLNKRSDSLVQADYVAETSYNTYTHDGLPLGPICNPSAESIEAALTPASGGSLYMFLAKENDKPEQLVFFSSLDEYESAKNAN